MIATTSGETPRHDPHCQDSTQHDSLASNNTNEVMRILTIIATIFMPITLIASLWGMNIPLPFARSDNALLYIILIMIGIISGMLYFFRRRNWI